MVCWSYFVDVYINSQILHKWCVCWAIHSATPLSNSVGIWIPLTAVAICSHSFSVSLYTIRTWFPNRHPAALMAKLGLPSGPTKAKSSLCRAAILAMLAENLTENCNFSEFQKPQLDWETLRLSRTVRWSSIQWQWSYFVECQKHIMFLVFRIQCINIISFDHIWSKENHSQKKEINHRTETNSYDMLRLFWDSELLLAWRWANNLPNWRSWPVMACLGHQACGGQNEAGQVRLVVRLAKFNSFRVLILEAKAQLQKLQRRSRLWQGHHRSVEMQLLPLGPHLKQNWTRLWWNRNRIRMSLPGPRASAPAANDQRLEASKIDEDT